MNTFRFGIIGGSGLYKMDGLAELREVVVETPYGAPSSPRWNRWAKSWR